jgi:hypothetical protein
MPGQHESQKGEGIAPGADGAGDSEGAGLKQAQEKGVADLVRVESPGRPRRRRTFLAAERQREHAAGGGQFDPDRIEGPVRRRERIPGVTQGPSRQSGGDCESECGLMRCEAAIKAGQGAEQNGGENSERHGANPAVPDWRPIQFEGKALTIR